MRAHTLLLAACAALLPAPAMAQSADAAARNDLPRPYDTEQDWAKLPPGLAWASVTSVEVSPDGFVFAIHRCFENSCADRSEPAILKFDKDGKFIQSFGAGMFSFPHGSALDQEGNLWVTDLGGSFFTGPKEGEDPGGKIVKFDPNGKVLLVIDRAKLGSSEVIDQPTDLVVTPSGELFVTEGHAPKGRAYRVVHFSKDGAVLGSWGKGGEAPGDFGEPHGIAIDTKGRLYIGDRQNNRVEIFDQTGKFIDQWHQFGRPSGIFVDKHDRLYVADSESSSDGSRNKDPNIRRGIRIGSAETGEVTAFIEDGEANEPRRSGAEGVSVDEAGNVYGAVVGRHMLERHVPKPAAR